ncbi:MAG: single-stranded-DNA-specific exonuclease RecJ, partial [Oscillospiraceae bacterium]|nr:single-stranded-DNA-specific exonuclease RecJ [Oscillospiraceae bacterium]
MKKWIYKNLDKNVVNACAKVAQIPTITAEVLMARGYDDAEKMIEFLNPQEFSNPYLLKDMDKAVERINSAVENGEKIAVYGDYDCDGVTATYIVYNYLSEIMGADVIYYIPSRNDEGYGLNTMAIDKLCDEGVSLIITVDNGITAISEADYAIDKGIDLVITDHHKPIDVLPKAVAIVNPHRVDCTSGLTYLCGAGIALKLVCALENDIDMIMDYYSQIAMLGTIADVVPIMAENRTILNAGIESLNNTENFGLLALVNKSCPNKIITEEDIAFSIVPKINASGRLGSADDALKLLLCEDEDTALEYAELITEENNTRKEIEQKIYDEALGYINENPAILNERIIIIAGENWHNGVSGIVAARLCTLLQKPVLLISSDGDEARGSGRSIGNFSLHRMLCHCSDLLIRHGGHILAAGFTLAPQNVDAFIKRAIE